VSSKKNCWEIKGCDRQSGGLKVPEMGLCPATTDSGASGVNSGSKGGRVCWALAGTFCGGKVQGTYASKVMSCINCEVFATVRREEGPNFRLRLPSQSPFAAKDD
jgi:hypothetical protein